MKKRIILIVITLLLIVGTITGVYLYLNKQDDNTLTILEKQWIEDNKNNRIDLEIENDIPIFSLDGEGLIYDFVESLEKNTELEFNIISNSEKEDGYAIKMVDQVNKNDIIIYTDNYSLVTNDIIKYSSISEMDGLIIGYLEEDQNNVSKYLDNKNINFLASKNVEELFNLLSEKKVNGILIPKTLYLNQILENNYNISYNVSEMTKDIVIRLGNEKKLNSIIKKYYKKWADENYIDIYDTYFSSNYYVSTNVDDDTKVDFKSKRYKYGFVSNAPYDELIDNKLVGTNSEIIKSFSKIADIEVTFNEYNSYTDLIKAFNENKIDFFYNMTSNNKYEMDILNSASMSDEKIVILTSYDNNIITNSIASLEDKTILVVTNSQIQKYLNDNNINTKTYDNIKQLLKKKKNSDILAIDYATYEIYKNDDFKDYRINYQFDLPTDYVYTSRDIKDNKLFNKYFIFYTSFINEKEFNNLINYKNFESAEKLAFVKPLVYSLFAITVLIIISIIIHKIKKQSKNKTGVSKENKLKYIDMLTSLKNRNYLNDSIEKWDESEVYPQSIIIVDLNNIAYINDNYGHSEGDNVITEAANILIKNQLEQSEIIRTNGNEFLIYLVGYEEKQVISYIRKLTKEFKELEHGFGAALGYSMINDGLKTVDDAINEATLDMRTNKEEANN